MVHIRGDTHGELSLFSKDHMPGEETWTREDILLITGDFGFLFRDSPREWEKLEALSRKPYTIAFLDGNHENFPLLETFPEEKRWGAPVKVLADNLFWLRRGNIYTMDGNRYFVMGGARSPDKARRLAMERETGERLWFPQELPSAEEYRRAIRNLKDCSHEVDYILTHTAPESLYPDLTGTLPDSHERELTGFLEWVYRENRWKGWFFGHFHEDRQLREGVLACLNRVHTVPSGGQM